MEREMFEVFKRKPAIVEMLHRMIELEEQNRDNPHYLGSEWFEIPASPSVLRNLVLAGLIRISYKSHSATHYRVQDIEKVKEALERFEMTEVPVVKEERMELPRDLFAEVVGYEDVKDLFMRGLKSRVHFLMLGPPSSAKSLFLLCLERLSKSRYVLGSRISKAGLADYLITYRPRIVLLDEIDKMNGADYGVLLSLLETGKVTEMMYGKTREEVLDTVVFASANTLKSIPSEVLSRFQILRFPEYSRERFMEIVANVLRRRGVNSNLATYIAEKSWDELEARDIRQAIRISKMATTKKEVDEVIGILRTYSRE